MSPHLSEETPEWQTVWPVTCQSQDTVYRQEDTSLLEEPLPCAPVAWIWVPCSRGPVLVTSAPRGWPGTSLLPMARSKRSSVSCLCFTLIITGFFLIPVHVLFLSWLHSHLCPAQAYPAGPQAPFSVDCPLSRKQRCTVHCSVAQLLHGKRSQSTKLNSHVAEQASVTLAVSTHQSCVFTPPVYGL